MSSYSSGLFSSGDSISVSVDMVRSEMGGRFVMSKSFTPKKVPFTLGPLQGTAFLVNTSELKSGDGMLRFSFELELVPDKEIALTEIFAEFFGAEVIE